jgi:hypothetical protein
VTSSSRIGFYVHVTQQRSPIQRRRGGSMCQWKISCIRN